MAQLESSWSKLKRLKIYQRHRADYVPSPALLESFGRLTALTTLEIMLRYAGFPEIHQLLARLPLMNRAAFLRLGFLAMDQEEPWDRLNDLRNIWTAVEGAPLPALTRIEVHPDLRRPRRDFEAVEIRNQVLPGFTSLYGAAITVEVVFA
ncbi:hypothetical protein C8R46DRAFT_1048966 [Mycena filopes]|nr:hypothetical protein C8R46DRAFT_1048966 [Mycena filopes]